jgi:non-specific serine/threonine protein kinase
VRKQSNTPRLTSRGGATIREFLPAEASSFVGRAGLVAALGQELDSKRLVTLTGPGGVGKTRIALKIARDRQSTGFDAVCFIDLAPVSASTSFNATLLSGLRLRELPEQEALATVVSAIGSQHVLLVLDNCEQVISACANAVHTLLIECANLHILVTSRERLGVQGEHVWAVTPLSVPSPEQTSIELIQRSEAVQLFLDRATAVRAGVTFTDKALIDVAEVCRRLDGLPLAIELAATRIPSLNVGGILRRLDDRFSLLTGGYRPAHTRQHTLRATVEWSYELLTEQEQRLLERLAVFAGSWTLEAAQAVCTGNGLAPDGVLDLTDQLVCKSLVVAAAQSADPQRYRFLETIRAFALGKLEADQELDSVRARHASYYLEQAIIMGEAAEFGEHRQRELDRMERDHANFREAMRWTLQNPSGVETRVDWAAALGGFWFMQGHFSEFREWLAHISSDPRPTRSWARVLLIRANIAAALGDVQEAVVWIERALTIAREVGDQRQVHRASANLGRIARLVGDYSRATGILEEAIASSRQAGDQVREALALLHFGWVAYAIGDLTAALERCEATFSIFQRFDDAKLSAQTTYLRGQVMRAQGDLCAAQAHYETALRLARETSSPDVEVQALIGLGQTAYARGDLDLSHGLLRDSVIRARDLGLTYELVRGVESMAGWAAADGQAALCLQLAGAASAYREAFRVPLSPTDQRLLACDLEPAYLALDAAAGVEYERGHQTPFEQAVFCALEASRQARRTSPTRQRGARRETKGESASLLTARESEVARAIALGLSNRQIAARLVITERTAGAHVEHILAKLGFTARTQIAAWAAERGLATTRGI